MRSRSGSSFNGQSATTTASVNMEPTTRERNGGLGGGGGGGSSGRSRLHHKRRPGHRRNTQHSVATVEPICDMRKVVNGVVSVDQEKLEKLVQTDPIDLHYAVEQEPFASGLFATVRKCRHRTTGVEYAAKYAAKIRYGQDCTTEILHEIALMSLCTTNPRIIHLIDVFDTPTHMILVMEYAPGGDLQTLMDDDMVPYERDAVKFVRQVLEGLLFLHERSMAHLDIKLQNVLLMGTFPDCDVKLCDLEISRIIVAGQEVRELLGTPDYVSPEILHYEPITLSADIWSVGVMAYVLLTGFTPFGGDSDQETFQNICHGQLDFPDELFEDISPQAEDFIRKTLTREPSCRPTVKECLKHPWLTSWKNVASHQRETISSESQRKTSSLHTNGPAATLACPRSAAAAAASINGHNSSPSTTARSLLRAMSKSREVLYERVAASNLRKSTSKSRERLCEMRLSVSRSRDHLCDLLSSASQSRERLHSLRHFSKSHEVLNLLKEHGSGQSTSDLPSLLSLLPSTQSLECFVIPDGDGEKSSPPPIDAASTTAAVADLSKALSESTETLCGENESTTQTDVTDEITPSNSRSETPTHEAAAVSRPEDQPINQPQPVETVTNETQVRDGNITKDASEPVSTTAVSHQLTEQSRTEALLSRADAVASLLKRLSTSGPPPLKSPLLPSESRSPPVAAKTPWNWPSTSATNSPDGASPTGKSSSSSSVSSPSPAPPSRHQSASSVTEDNTSSPVTSLSLADPSRTEPKPVPTQVPSSTKSSSGSIPLPVVSTTPAETSTGPSSGNSGSGANQAALDTTSLTDSQRQLLASCINRRRASWAYGSRQDDVTAVATTASIVSSRPAETKLSVSELITSFNQSKDSTSSSTATSKPIGFKKLSTTPAFLKESVASSSGLLSSTSRAISEKEKSVFKPLSSSIQAFQKNLVSATPVPLPTPSTNVTGGVSLLEKLRPSTVEPGTRPRSHHLLSWDVRALPRLPEDVVCPPRIAEESTPSPVSEACGPGDSKVKEVSAHETEEDFGLRSGSVSSDTGCSSSSDLSDRSSDEGLDVARELGSSKPSATSGSGPEADLIEGAITSPPVNWTGRPRSFSVQSEISLLAQPWNRVCNGSVARAFEKFGTKVESDTSSVSNPTVVNRSLRSRRQSTPGPFK